jgi:TonB family protein
MIEIGKIHSAVSKRMLIISVAVHGIAVCALVVCSALLVTEKPKQPEVVKVKFKLEEPKPGLPTVEKLTPAAAPVELPKPSPELAVVESSPAPSPTKNETIVAKQVSQPDSIKVTRKRKQPKVVENVPEAKPKPVVKKEENAKEAFEKRMADLHRKEEGRPKTAQPVKPEEPSRGMMGKGDADEQNAWFQKLRSSVNQNWALLGENTDKSATTIGLKIADDGNLLKADVEESSGDPSFDKSALRAVFQAAPFPPLPPGLRDRIKQEGGMALKFTRRGMQ